MRRRIDPPEAPETAGYGPLNRAELVRPVPDSSTRPRAKAHRGKRGVPTPAASSMSPRSGYAQCGQLAPGRAPCRSRDTTVAPPLPRNGVSGLWVLNGAIDGLAFAVWIRPSPTPALAAGDLPVRDKAGSGHNRVDGIRRMLPARLYSDPRALREPQDAVRI